MKDAEFTPETPQEQTEMEEATQPEAPVLLQLPIQDEQLAELRAGQWVDLSGTLYVIGHQASTSLLAAWEAGEDSPIELEQATVYFTTPGRAPIGVVIGSLAPNYTDDFNALSQQLCDRGVRCLIGRGPISDDVIHKLKRKRGVYLVTVGGAGALLARTVHQAQIVALEDLGLGAIRALKVERFPCVVAIDGFGRNLFQIQPQPPQPEDPPDTEEPE